jgi:hypothetical protein
VKKVEFKKYIQDLDTFYTLGFPAFWVSAWREE